ncbi:ABC transporter permease [Kitasatospora sp. NPDC008050]|uniref:ABC transporter permease n=1 Tax=Kitasatospora sp. NPDC008050 TaxID=3364021 RepID=UPI0036E008AE
MTTTMDSRPTSAAARTVGRGPRPRGIAWLMWRQNRTLISGLLLVLVALTIAAPILRAEMVSFIDSHHIKGCAAISRVPSCRQDGISGAVTQFRNGYGTLMQGFGILLLLLPVGLGAGLGATLLGRELENGTWKLALSQSVSRDRWVAAKLLTAGLIGVVASTVPALLLHWVWGPSANEVSGITWFSMAFYPSSGPVLVATTLLALSVGVLAGLLLRQVLRAAGLTVLVVGLFQYGQTVVRPHLWSWQTSLADLSDLPNSTWAFAHGLLLPDGRRVSWDVCNQAGDYEKCMAQYHGAKHFSAVHQAANYWPLQLVESGICLALAAALTALTVVWVRKRLV